MDCVAVFENGKIHVREFRNLKRGDLVFTGRKEDGEEGIFVYPDGFRELGQDGVEAPGRHCFPAEPVKGNSIFA